jgi:hypothetical protein
MKELADPVPMFDAYAPPEIAVRCWPAAWRLVSG